MKKIIMTIALLAYVAFLHAQDKNIENEIRNLEQSEVKAVLEKDSVMLLRLWDKDYVVNSPDNVVVFPGKSTLDRPVLKKSKISFTREVEQIIIKGDVIFSMGNETVTPLGDDKISGQIIKRRYTNIWMKREGLWKLVARHANVICQNK
ncbi:MAG: nuclear transport factor 2 family protein [Ferruginibacter sp.]